MSQLFQVATRGNGTVPVVDGVAAPDYVDQGIPFDAGGRIAVDFVGAIHHYHQGLPFTAAGRLVGIVNAVVTRLASGGAPFDAVNKVVFGSSLSSHVGQGIPYTFSDQITTS